MTELQKQEIFQLLRQVFTPGEPVPISQAQALLRERGVACLDLGYFTFRDLFADMPQLLELRQRPDAPLLYDLVLLDAQTPETSGEQSAPPENEPRRPDQAGEPSQPQQGRCVLTPQQRREFYRVLWEHYPLEFDIPFTDAAPLAAQFGYTPQRFYQGEGQPKAYHLFQALEPWVQVTQADTGVYYVNLKNAPEALEGTQPITGKRAGLTEEDRARICRCLAESFPVGAPISLTDLGNALVTGGVDFRAMGFSRTPRLLPCLMEDLSQVMADPRHTGQQELCVELKPSIRRYLPEGNSEPRDPAKLLEEERDQIIDLLIRQFGPGTLRPMAAVFLQLNQEGLGSKRYNLKGLEMLDRLGIRYEKVASPEHPGNTDYMVTIPGASAEPVPESQPQAVESQVSEPVAQDSQTGQPEAPRRVESSSAPTPEPQVPGIAPPPSRWENQVFFHLKTQGILAEFLGTEVLDQQQLDQIGRDYDQALAQGQVRWVENKACYSFPLSLVTRDGRPTFLSIKTNDFPGGPAWRVSFVGYGRVETPDRQPRPVAAPVSRPAAPGVSQPVAPGISQPVAPVVSQPTPAGTEASAEEITSPAFTRLSDRDKLEIYNTLLPLSPVGSPMLLNTAGTILAAHGITPQRFGYARMLQLVSDMPEYLHISSAQPRPDAPLVYSISLLPQSQAGTAPVQDQANGEEPPFAMTERTIAFPASQQGFLSRFLNDPEGVEKLTEEQITEFQTSYDTAVSNGTLVYDPAYQCYKFPLSLVARDGRALMATIKRSDRPVPPAWYVSFIEKRADQGVRPGDKLKQFAHLGNIQEFLASLASHAEAEKWSFYDDPQDYSILWNYISYTFYRLDFEGKVYMDPNGAFAAFNTGLLSRRFGEDLLAYFEPYSGPGDMKWKFVCFCSGTNEAKTGQERKAVTLLAPLSLELPQYFSNLYDTMFDPSTKLESNFMHIIRDNLARFPLNWLHKQCDDHQRTKVLLAEIEEERTKCRDLRRLFGDQAPEVLESRRRQKELFHQLGEAVTDESDDAMCDLLMDMKDLFEGAVGRTMDRCRRNFKLAVPCYFPTRNVMSMLLPISFSRAKNGAPCMALVAERQKNGIYLGRTVLTMRMAYNDARLLCRPTSEWLDTSASLDETGLDDNLED